VWFSSMARRLPERPTPLKIAAATLYMLIWSGIIIAGRYIAYR